MLKIFLDDAGATERLGATLAQWLRQRGHGLLALHGDLGAGKTTLARGLLRALGVSGPIRSPSYTLLEPYHLGELRVLHMDFYRLQGPEELDNLGLRDDPPEQCIWLVEWPERAGELLPSVDLNLQLQAQGSGRLAVLQAAPALEPDLHQALALAAIQAEPEK